MSRRDCTICKKDLPLESFGVCDKPSGRRRHQCKVCHTAANKARNKKNDHWRKKAQANYKKNHLDGYMLSHAKFRAKSKGIEFSLTKEDIEIPKYCPVLGIELIVSKGKATHNSPSLDRIDNTKGYIPGNVIVVSYRANTLKNDASLDEMRALVNYYSKLLTE